MKGLSTYINLLKEPAKTWKKLAQNPGQSSLKAAYIIMIGIIPFAIIGKLIDTADLNWNLLITNALVAFISLLTGLYVATSLCKLYSDKTTKQGLSFADTLHYIAHASVAVYATVWLVELAQMPIFWLCSLYTLKIVLESIQSKYIMIDDDKKYTYVWVISTIIIASPYFMHYVLDAVYEAGLWSRYGMDLLQRWQVCLQRTEKGLAEGWDAFKGDFSHAWGGTPAYQLPARLSGLKILSPGFARISLRPELYGLDSAFVRIPTRYGAIEIEMKKGEPPRITVPNGITVE